MAPRTMAAGSIAHNIRKSSSAASASSTSSSSAQPPRQVYIPNLQGQQALVFDRDSFFLDTSVAQQPASETDQEEDCVCATTGSRAASCSSDLSTAASPQSGRSMTPVSPDCA